MGNQIKKYRELRGLNQSQLAEQAGTTRVQISRVEATDPEKKRDLTETLALKLAPVLKCQPGDLMPVITDGSVPLKTDIEPHEKLIFQEAMSRFFEVHTEFDQEYCDRLGMAALKFYLMALASAKEQQFLDVAALTGIQAPGQSTQ